MQFSQTGNIEKIKKSKQFSQDEATERTRKGRKDNKRHNCRRYRKIILYSMTTKATEDQAIKT